MSYHAAYMRALCLAFVICAIAAFAADRDLAGGYAGQWKSNTSGNGGALRFTLGKAGNSWKSTASVAVNGNDLTCAMRTVKVGDASVELVYEFDVDNTPLRTTQKGDWKGGEFQGTYQTTTLDGEMVDAGTWTAKSGK